MQEVRESLWHVANSEIYDIKSRACIQKKTSLVEIGITADILMLDVISVCIQVPIDELIIVSRQFASVKIVF